MTNVFQFVEDHNFRIYVHRDHHIMSIHASHADVEHNESRNVFLDDETDDVYISGMDVRFDHVETKSDDKILFSDGIE